MKMREVMKMAKPLGIKSFGKKKIDLIHEIQRKEGNLDCYGRSNGDCDQLLCCFRDSCLEIHETGD